MPHDTRDPVPVAAAIVTALQALVTRRFNAAHAIVITITQMEAGSAHNIIPDHVRLAGTIRTLDDADRRVVHEAIGQVARSIAAAHDQQACVTITPGFPVTMNDPRAVALAQAVAQQAGGPDAFETMPAASMGAEDFSYVLQKVPGAMIFMGVAEEGADWQACCGIHSPRMLVDETALPTGAAFLAACALHYGEHGWSVGES
jgi:hippurate hydrolase